MRPLLLASALVFAAVSVLAFGATTTTAEHAPTGDNDPQYVLRAFTRGPLGQAVASRGYDANGFATGIPAIARNIVTLGSGASADPISVCAAGTRGNEDAYAELVEQAVAVWNTGLGVNIFKYAENTSETVTLTADGIPSRITTNHCAATSTEIETASIVVRQTHNLLMECGADPDASSVVACFAADTIENHPWLTYTGRSEVLIHHKVFNGLSDREKQATITHELGHAIGLAHPFERGFTTYHPGSSVTEPMTHYWEVRGCSQELEFNEYNPTTRTYVRIDVPLADINDMPDRLRNLYEGISESSHGGAIVMSGVGCKGDKKKGDGWEWNNPVALQTYDVAVFNKVYSPAAVKNLAITASSEAGKVDVTWDVSEVHVEKGFIVQVKTTAGWHEIARTGPNMASVRVLRPSDGAGVSLARTGTGAITYRVVSHTDAFGSAPPKTTSIVTSSSGGTTTTPGRETGGGGIGGGGGIMETCTQTLTVYTSLPKLGNVFSVTGHLSRSGNVYVFACNQTATVTAASRVARGLALPDVGFVRWEGACRGTDPASCSVAVSGSRILRAVYEEIPLPGSYSLESKQENVTVWSWSASCGIKSGSGGGYSNELSAIANGAQWVSDNCTRRYSVSTTYVSSSFTTWGWAGACTDGSGNAGTGGGFATSAAAGSAGWSWAAATCDNTTDGPEPLEPVEIVVYPESSVYTSWSWSTTCSDGTKGGGGGFSTQGAANGAANTWGQSNCPATYSLLVNSQTVMRTVYRYVATCTVGSGAVTSEYLPTVKTAAESARRWIWDACE